jgi:hypothetical protein
MEQHHFAASLKKHSCTYDDSIPSSETPAFMLQTPCNHGNPPNLPSLFRVVRQNTIQDASEIGISDK